MRFLAQIIIGSIIAALLIKGFNSWTVARKQNVPASKWMQVTHLSVDDHIVDQDPEIRMKRFVKKQVTGRWIAEVHAVHPNDSSYSNVCWGSDVSVYSSAKFLPDPLNLSWFMGKKCNLEVGLYRLCGTWLLQPSGYPEKIVRACSANFEVRPKDNGSQVQPTQRQDQ